ncbi:MAG: Fe-S cluster assembly protein SufB [Gemmatimonadetes bacterium]|nr:Fe-S cluster assembly protein SufB [Gemmatimonadota bacterium]
MAAGARPFVPRSKTRPEIARREYEAGFHDQRADVFRSDRGLTERIVNEISSIKGEPEWMRRIRLNAYETYIRKPIPTWGADLSGLDFDSLHYYVRPTDRPERSWEDVPEDIKSTFERLGIPEAERKYLAGVSAQYDSEIVYHSIHADLEKQGVIFLGMDEGVREFPDIVKRYFGTVVPAADNKFAALNTAVWSGGSFVYVPAGAKVQIPLQAYFRINSESMGQFERTLLVVEEGAEVHYVEGCTAPMFTTESLHSAVGEAIVKKGARCRYTNIQNWYSNVYNLVTKRALVQAEAKMEWVDCNLGSRVTMKYPAAYLMGPKARAETLSVAMAGQNQHQDTGAKVVHAAPETTSTIVSKSVSRDGGRASYRGLVKVYRGMHGCASNVRCDALILDPQSRSDTYPRIEVDEPGVNVTHEATVSKIADEQLFYLMSRGIDETEAARMIVNGFIEPISKELPMEYAVEMNRLISLQMDGALG